MRVRRRERHRRGSASRRDLRDGATTESSRLVLLGAPAITRRPCPVRGSRLDDLGDRLGQERPVVRPDAHATASGSRTFEGNFLGPPHGTLSASLASWDQPGNPRFQYAKGSAHVLPETHQAHRCPRNGHRPRWWCLQDLAQPPATAQAPRQQPRPPRQHQGNPCPAEGIQRSVWTGRRGASGTVDSVSTSSFTISTSAGQKVTVNEASSTTYRKGTSSTSASAIKKGRKRPRTRDDQRNDHHGQPGHRATD